MERKYYYARTVGTPESVLQRITTTVVAAELASEIPLVKLERRARGEFYVFLCVESEETHGIPGGLGKSLQELGLRFDENVPLLPDQVKTMVQRQNIEIHGFSALRYRQREYADPGDPFDLPEVGIPRSVSPESGILMERLLHWLSAHADGTWEGFKKTCDVLQLVHDGQEARSVLRRFVLLGHMDLSPDGSRWSVAPPVLVRFPGNPDGGFLSGRRTESFLKNVRETWPLVETPHHHYAGPPRLDFTHFDSARNSGLEITDGGIASIRLAALLPDRRAWMDSLQPIGGLAVSTLQVQKWQTGRFQPCDTLYERDGVYYGDSGMYRIRREGDRSGRALTVFFDEPSQRWLRGDWYGLRFLSLGTCDSGANAVHESDAEVLSIPVAQRWPLLYERALTLASGMLPERATNPEWLSYANISWDLARDLCGKLNVDLREN